MPPVHRKPATAGAAAAALLAALGFGRSTALAGETLVDDFESAGAPAPWTFSNGPEFPGAQGALTRGAGRTGYGARLAFDFSGGGRYVSATRVLAAPTAAAGIAFQVRSVAGIHVVLRVTDTSGQVLQFTPARPLYAGNPSAWYRHGVRLDAPDGWWAGANDGVVHGGITSIMVLAANPLETGAGGAVDLDDVVLLDAEALSPSLATSTRLGADAGAASAAAGFGVQIRSGAGDQELDAAEAAGFTWARIDLLWDVVEQQAGTYDFTSYDPLVSALESRGMGALFVLGFSSPLYADGLGYAPRTSAAVQAFGAYARAAAQHFAGRRVRFEVWSEPNLDASWKPAADAAAYSAAAQAAVAGVHEGSTAAEVATGSTSGVDFTFLRAVIGAGGAQAADAVSVHPYRSGAPETASDDLLLLRSILATRAPQAEAWSTEWGYSSTSFGGDGAAAAARQRQAVLTVREVLTVWALGLQLGVYYDMRDDGTDPANADHNYGLLAADYSEKPAMTALRTLAAMRGSRTLVAHVAAVPSTLHAIELDGADDAVFVVWSSAGATPLIVPAGAEITDMLGAPAEATPVDGGLRVTASESAGPLYVLTSKPAGDPINPQDSRLTAYGLGCASGGARAGGGAWDGGTPGGLGAAALFLSCMLAVRAVLRRSFAGRGAGRR